jgi:hypothetical protein
MTAILITAAIGAALFYGVRRLMLYLAELVDLFDACGRRE